MVLVSIHDSFRGLINVGGRNYCFELKKNKESDGSTIIKIDWRLKKILSFSLDNFFATNEFSNVQEFYLKFKEFVENNILCDIEDEKWLKSPVSAYDLFKMLQEDIKNYGEYIKSVDIVMKTVIIEYVDTQFRTHKAVLELCENYPKGFLKVLEQDLPTAKTLFNENLYDFTKLHTISDFIRRFSSFIISMQEFWNTMAIIDMQCLVLDPLNPTYKDTYRRIKITDTLSIGLTVDPLKPRQIPIIKFFGFLSEVEHFKEVLQKNLGNEIWDCGADLIYNINNVLEVTIFNKMFVKPAEISELIQEEECAICFMWRLEDELPNEICETLSCKSKYHSLCLFKYLSSFPKNQNYFGKIQGECPNCDNVIFCSVPNLSDY